MASDLRLIFLGTRDFALPTLRTLMERGESLVGVVTQPDRPQGRRREPQANAVKQLAAQQGIPVFQPEGVNSAESTEVLNRWRPDLLVLVAYGQILSENVLGIPERGGINLHGSLLPRYRGAAPVAWAIYDGETETGVTVIRMTPKLDAGAILSRAATPIRPDETAGELEARLAELGAPLVCSAVEAIATGKIEAVPQDVTRQSRYARRLEKNDGLIDWSRSGRMICAQVRAMQPWPTAYTFFHGRELQEPVRVLIRRIREGPTADGPEAPGTVVRGEAKTISVQTGESTSVWVDEVQPAGKRSMTAVEFKNGYRVAAGDHFGSATNPESGAGG